MVWLIYGPDRQPLKMAVKVSKINNIIISANYVQMTEWIPQQFFSELWCLNTIWSYEFQVLAISISQIERMTANPIKVWIDTNVQHYNGNFKVPEQDLLPMVVPAVGAILLQLHLLKIVIPHFRKEYQ